MEPPFKKLKLPAKKEITFITGNAKKLEEFKAIMASYNLDNEYFFNSYKMDLPELQAGDYYEIVKAKCRHAVSILGKPVLIEDSGLGFDSMNGLPGPYIKWFLEKIGNDGLYRMLTGFGDNRAQAHCIFGYCPGPGCDVVMFDGCVEGQIVEPCGNNGFGWDAIFQPDGEMESYGEMDAKKKNEISPRKKAIDMLASYLGNLYVI